jgi:hypothetical protein
MSGHGTVAEVLAFARAQNGYREGAGNRNKFSAMLGRPPEAWCADFVEVCLEQAGVPGVLKSAYCPTIESDYKRKGHLFTTPRIGDQGFVRLLQGGAWVAGHTFIVIGVSADGRSVHTSEGNTNTDGSSNGIGVFERIRPVLAASGHAGVRSYGRPLYQVAAPSPTPPRPTPKPTPTPVSAQAVQRAVHVTADGKWGPLTDRAVQLVRTAARQGAHGNVRSLQIAVGASPDGIWGPKSARALNQTIRLVQAALHTAPDGSWGPITDAAFVAARARYFNRF